MTRFHRLSTVDGVIAFDLDIEGVFSAGGTRCVPDGTDEEAAVLARAMTYKFGVLGLRTAGAKAVVRAAPHERDEVMARYCDEIRPLLEAGVFATGADLGTHESDFAPLRSSADADHPIRSVVGGVAFEDLVTGYGVASAVDVATDGVSGKRVAIEGFGKVGGGLARELVIRGAQVVAVSTVAGCVVDDEGLDVEALLALRSSHGDECVVEAGLGVRPTADLFEVPCDVLVPGARPGVIDADRARRLAASVVVPAANVPYRRGAIEVLVERGVRAHADFLCNAGGVLGYTEPADASPDDVLDAVGRTIERLVDSASAHPGGPYAGAVAIAEDFMRSWLPAGSLPDEPPVA